MYLDVGFHRLYYEEHGLPTGRPIVVLHGGPGGGLSRGLLKYVDLSRDRVILYDQRGCGRSTPHLSLYKNTTWDLVADLEKLRNACGIQQWIIFGGSWGTTLALAYASKHMAHIAGFVLRGVCMNEGWENDWMYGKDGVARLYPSEFKAFASVGSVHTYKRLLRNRRTRKAAATAWCKWEKAIASLDPTTVRSVRDPPNRTLSLAVLENHYFTHDSWIRPGQLLRVAAKIPRSVPILIVQGRYDLICPAAGAISLAKAAPHAKLWLTVAGHSGADPENVKALREAFRILPDLPKSAPRTPSRESYFPS